MIVPDGLAINFTATNYSGSGAWTNLGGYGTNFNATVEAGTPSKNAAGNGVVFNGSTNFTFPNIAVGNAWTASVWAKRTGSNDPGGSYLTQLNGDGGGGVFVMNMSLYTNFIQGDGANASSNQVNGGFYNAINGWRNGGAINLSLNTWVNFTYTWNGTTISAYSNGSLIASLSPGINSSNSGLAYRIGRRWDVGGSAFIRSEIGQVLIYNRALTSNEVMQNYTATSNVYIV
jgi:hypothetical protein